MDQPLDFSVKSPRVNSPGSNSADPFSCRSSSKRNGSFIKDEQYWQRREKNNAAAKRSRDARRQKEEQTKSENEILREENKKLRYQLEEHLTVCPHLSLSQTNNR